MVALTDSTSRLESLILAFVQKRDWVSFVELERLLQKHGVEPRGDLAMLIGEPEQNVFAWFNMSREFFDAVHSLLATHRLHLWPAEVLIYVLDGRVPQAPIPKRATKKGRDKPHWLPVTLRLKPYDAETAAA